MADERYPPCSSKDPSSMEERWEARDDENQRLFQTILDRLTRIKASSTQGSTPATTPRQSLEAQARIRVARERRKETPPNTHEEQQEEVEGRVEEVSEEEQEEEIPRRRKEAST